MPAKCIILGGGGGGGEEVGFVTFDAESKSFKIENFLW